MSEISAPRFAHTEGYTAVTFSSNGDFLITGGADSLIRVFHTDKKYRDLEAKTLEYHNDSISSLSYCAEKLISSDETGTTLSFSVAKGNEENIEINPSGTIYKASLAVWDIKPSPNGMQVAVSSEDGNIYIVSLLDMTILAQTKNPDGSINSIDYDPSGKKLVTSSNDGSVKIWESDGFEIECIHTWKKLAAQSQPGEAEEQIKVRWQPNGKLIAVPDDSGNVLIYDTEDFTEKKKLSNESKSIIKHLAWSPNGKYLACIGGKQITLWNTGAQKTISQHTHSEELCAVVWHPTENTIAFTDNLGAVMQWDNVVDLEKDIFENTHLATPKSKNTGFDSGLVNKFLDLESEAFAEESLDGSDDGMEDFVVDDDGAGYAKQKWKNQLEQENKVEPFQPSATPMIGNKCYLTFNMVGSVISTKVDDSHNSVEIEFFDKSIHRDVRFSDPYKFSMASLSNLGCLFGMNPSIEDVVGKSKSGENRESRGSSFILYRAFKGWAGQSDWNFKLESGEFIQCLALSNNGAAVFTSLKLIRFFSIGGIQTWVESIPENILCCVAKDNLVFSVYQKDISNSIGNRYKNQKENFYYDWELRRMDTGERLSFGSCPVSSFSKITWVGFSEESIPLLCDSEGIVRCLSRCNLDSSSSWMPIFDANKVKEQRNKNENYWPVGLLDSKFYVAIIRGKSKYPPIPKPILSELDIKIPLLHPNSTTTNEEHTYMLKSIMTRNKKLAELSLIAVGAKETDEDDLELDKLLLSSINIACKSEKLMRALDLVTMLRTKESLLAAEKIAVFHKNEMLAQRIMKIRSDLMNEEEEYDDDSDGNDYNMVESNKTNDLFNEKYSSKKPESRNGNRTSKTNKALENQKDSAWDDSDENDDSDDEIEVNASLNEPNYGNKYPDSLADNTSFAAEKSSQATFGNISIVNSTTTETIDFDDAYPHSSSLDSSKKRTANNAFNPFAMKANSPSTQKDSGGNSSKKLKPLTSSSNPFDIDVPKDINGKVNAKDVETKGGKKRESSKTEKGKRKESKTTKSSEDSLESKVAPASSKAQTLLASFAYSSAKKD
ncbi:hypothetical protein BB558_000368 [Smittium angustum]|uniref:Uncharacterized protein n=1 Tax=Smittium angustum TaxID=133377 RepID=A0A2U1JEB0_SMIAN|nr:hypothetical protein BB558_000368 [Smittium angustum]